MHTSDHQILDSAFVLHSATRESGFFERMEAIYTGAPVAVSSTVHVCVHEASASELAEAVTDWDCWGHFHRSLNYPQWNLEGPVEPSSIFLPREGMLFHFSLREAKLDVYADSGRARRQGELVFHAARNLALWRRSERLRPMLHASAVLVDGVAWLFLGNKGAGKSTLFADCILRHAATPLSNDRILLDQQDGKSVWSWPSYLSYCEGTILDYPELQQVFDAAAGTAAAPSAHLYRRSYEQLHKRIAPPFLFKDVLGRRYSRRAPIGGVVCAQLRVGHAAGLSVQTTKRTAGLEAADIADAVFGHDDPDFPGWHGECGQGASRTDAVDYALDWLRAADVPFLKVVLDPVLGKPSLSKFFVQ